MEQHINLIRSIAWNFHRTTGIQWQELFSEACLAYCECLRSYDPTKSATTTWVYTAMKNALINFCKREGENRHPQGVESWFESSFTPMYEFFETSPNLSRDTREIIEMVRSNPSRYTVTPTKIRGKYKTPVNKVIGQIRNDLREQKQWSWPRIWQAMKTMRTELTQDRSQRTVWIKV